jgi:putative aldouronate transport system permease protein
MHWNEWFAAMIYVRDPSKTVMQLLLRRIMLEGQLLAEFPDLAEEGMIRPSDSSIRAATLFVAIGPIVLVYPFIQKYFIKGIMVGSVKG